MDLIKNGVQHAVSRPCAHEYRPSLVQVPSKPGSIEMIFCITAILVILGSIAPSAEAHALPSRELMDADPGMHADPW